MLFLGLDQHCRSIGQDFGDALHDFRGVIAGADYRVGPQVTGVLQHQIESFGSRLFAQVSSAA